MEVMVGFREWVDDLLGLVYPRLCAACGSAQPLGGHCLCLRCEWDLPRTDFHRIADNTMSRRLTGRFPLEGAAAMFYFLKDSPVQQLLHRIKYQGQSQAAHDLGRFYGRELIECRPFDEANAIIPVPLHPRRQHFRGFNQSAWFGKGLSSVMEIPLLEDRLVRTKATLTQTSMSRSERLDNMKDAFRLKSRKGLAGQHILLVDDVMTTGATLEACALSLLTVPGVRISLVTLAIARD